ncbi:MAG: isochorismatase family protein [archaeon]
MDYSELRERGFGCSMGFGDPALIVIDMLNAFTHEEMPLGTDLSSQIGAINTLLGAAHEKNVPVYFTAVRYDDMSEAGIWYRKQKGLASLRSGTDAVEIDPRIHMHPEDRLIVKNYASAFFGTDLASRLNSSRKDTLIITGCTTSGCVRATAVDTIQYGYIPVVVEEAVGDRIPEAHDQSLADLHLKYADVMSLDEVLKHV